MAGIRENRTGGVISTCKHSNIFTSRIVPGLLFRLVLNLKGEWQDVISPEYLEELALLQDRIAPFSTEMALQIVEQELGIKVEQLFTELSPQPVAAASLGQVLTYSKPHSRYKCQYGTLQ